MNSQGACAILERKCHPCLEATTTTPVGQQPFLHKTTTNKIKSTKAFYNPSCNNTNNQETGGLVCDKL
jgi:hypothetical protein